MPELDEEEQAAMDDLLSCLNRVTGWGLKSNHQELTQAVHVIQGFIIQRMLQRLNPEQFGRWYKEI